MTQRELREQIFKLLFEYEVVKSDIEERKEEFLMELKMSKSKKIFFNDYIDGIVKNERKIIEKIEDLIKGWTYTSLGNVEKVILKMSFYEIIIVEVGHEIVINEAVELAKIYGDENTKSFINGILGDLLKTLGEN